MSVAPLNPFTSQTVSSLRKIEPPIRWLNDAALRKLLAVFELVEEIPHRCELVQPVLSKGDGFGKSHLLGRLIQELPGRATVVSAAPYHDPLTCWVTLLQSMLNELSQPELIHHLPYPPTQLDELAHRVFGFLTVMLADKGATDTPIPGENRDDLLEKAFEKWDLSDSESPLGVWVNETLTACEQDAAREAVLVRLLKAATLHTYNDDASAMNWLLVLHRYASDRADEDSRQMCLEWMLTNQLEVPAETFLQNDEQLAGNNLIARQQTLDLLALAKLHRPFLLCFDQTDSLTTSLARSFGNMLLDLVRDEGAHFCIVTANSALWESTLLPEFDPACLPCLAPKMELAGLTREQGRSLAEQRLQRNGDSVELQEIFLKKSWFEDQFAKGSLGQRDFLQRCEVRYQELVPDAIKPSDEVESPEMATVFVEPLLQDVVPSVPAPDFSDAHEPAPASPAGSNSVIMDAVPPLPAIDVADSNPDPQETALEAPLKSLPESYESAQSPAAPVIEPTASAVIIAAVSESDTHPAEVHPSDEALENTVSQLTAAPLVVPPPSVEIIETVNESNFDPAESVFEARDPEPSISEFLPTNEQISTPVLVAGISPLPEKEIAEEVPLATEPTEPAAILPNTFSALTPLVEMLDSKAEGGSDLPAALLPPALEEFVSEPVDTATGSETATPQTSIEEIANDLSEPEKPSAESTPPGRWPSIFTEEPAETDHVDAAAEVLSSGLEAAPVNIPSQATEAPEPQPFIAETAEPLPGPSPEIPQEIHTVPSVEDIAEPFVPEPLLREETLAEQTQIDAEPPLSESSVPQVSEIATDITTLTAESQAAEMQEKSGPATITAEDGPNTTISAVPAPVIKDVSPAAAQDAPDIAAVTVEDDQA
ncbi:MAG: hypothetical protein RL693_943, partial [Verrucomicrobiota bacterium]